MSEKPSPAREVVVTRQVWADNLEHEFDLIGSIIDSFPIISVDTEFPRVDFITGSPGGSQHIGPGKTTEDYGTLKPMVDSVKLIQIGLTLSDPDGNLPRLGTENGFIWEFNFKDFDVANDAHARDSVELLHLRGIDFEKNRVFGIDSVRFAELMMSSGLVLNNNVTWLTFHSEFDFGHLLKCLRGQSLPNQLPKFLDFVHMFFGQGAYYDVKQLMRFCAGLAGGLNYASSALGVKRAIGNSHQTGSDSLLTLDAWFEVKKRCFGKGDPIEKYANVLYGLKVDTGKNLID